MKNAILPFLTLSLLIACNSRDGGAGEQQKIDESADSVELIIDNDAMTDSAALIVADDHFNEALALLDSMAGYQSQDAEGNKLYTNQSAVDPKLISQFRACATEEPALNDIDFGMVTRVKAAFVKSRKPIEPQLFLKVSIEEWQLSSDSTASAFKALLDKHALDQRECINKGGIEWWQIGDRLYVMTTPAFRYFFEFDNIREILNRKLDQ